MRKCILGKWVGVSGLLLMSLTACTQEPNTPMEAVMSDVKTNKYSIDFYESLHESDYKAYRSLVEYCHEHRNKPNCDNVQRAESNIFNRDPPMKLLHR